MRWQARAGVQPGGETGLEARKRDPRSNQGWSKQPRQPVRVISGQAVDRAGYHTSPCLAGHSLDMTLPELGYSRTHEQRELGWGLKWDWSGQSSLIGVPRDLTICLFSLPRLLVSLFNKRLCITLLKKWANIQMQLNFRRQCFIWTILQ